jgi:hypothetical protein
MADGSNYLSLLSKLPGNKAAPLALGASFVGCVLAYSFFKSKDGSEGDE